MAERDWIERDLAWSRQCAELELQRDRYREALARYGTHRIECASNAAPPRRGPCDCGWDTALDPERDEKRAHQEALEDSGSRGVGGTDG